MKHVPGAERGEITLFALSTCVWCGKTKALLNELGIAYDFEDVDLLADGERDRAVAAIARWNPGVSFPTLVFADKDAIIGFDEVRIREALGR